MLSDFHRTEKGFPTNLLIGCIVLIIILFILFTRPSIYYSENSFFIKKIKNVEIEIPFEKIESIKLSILGFSQYQGSWLVKYYSTDSKLESIRIFPSFTSESCSKFVKTAKGKNPKIIVRNWSIGINELFD